MAVGAKVVGTPATTTLARAAKNMNADTTNPAMDTIKQSGVNVLQTWKAVVLHPKKFFAELPLEGSLEQPLIFLGCMLVVSSLGHLLTGGVLGYAGTLLGNAATQAVFIAALTYAAKLFGGVADFKNMARACCYASAPMVLHLLGPLGLAGNLYGVYLLFLSVGPTQKLDAKKSAFTVASACLAAVLVASIWHILFHAKPHH
jgi:hypothetical protein